MSKTAWRIFCALVLLLFLLRGLMLACIIPPLEMWDEYQHFSYIQYLLNQHRLPIYGQSDVPGAVVQQAMRFPEGGAALRQLGPSGAVGYRDFWQRFPQRPQVRPAAPLPLYEAQHPPLYHWLMQPIFRAAGGTARLANTVGVLRLVNLAIAAAGFAVLLAWLGVACCDRREAALLALLVSLHPLLLLNVVRVSNDSLAWALGIPVVVWALAAASRRPAWPTRRALALAIAAGVALGLGILAKATDIALLPFCGVALVVMAIRTRALGQALLAAAALAATLLLITGWHFAFSLRHYGMLVPMQQTMVLQQRHQNWHDVLRWSIHQPLRTWLDLWRKWSIHDGLWYGGWSFIHPLPLFPRVFEGALMLAAIGWPVAWLFRREFWHTDDSRATCGTFRNAAIVPMALALGIIVFAGLTWHAAQALMAWGEDGTWPWYATDATPWLLLAVGAGAIGWRKSRLGYGVAFFLPLWFALTEWTSVWTRMIHTYTQLPLSPDALHRLSALQPAWLGTPTLLASSTAALLLLATAMVWCTRLLWEAYRSQVPTSPNCC